MKSYSKVFSLLAILLLNSVTVFAQDVVAPVVAGEGGAPAENVSFTAQLAEMLPMFLMIFFIFYFLVVRPQAKQLKDHNKMMSELKRGDEVVTNFGLFARVAGIEKDYILLEVASGVKVRVLTSSVARKVDNTANV